MKIEKLDYNCNFLYPQANVDLHIWKKATVNMHTHNFYEFIIVQKGHIQQVLNGKKTVLKQNSLTLIKPTDAHSLSFPVSEPCQHINLSFKTDFFRNTSLSISPNLFNKLNQGECLVVNLSNKEITQVNYWITKIYSTNNSFYDTKISLTTSLYFYLLSMFISVKKQDEEKIPEWLQKMIEIINAPDFIDKTANDIYSISPYSSSALIKQFKKHLKCTPSQYLITLKINYACNLLESTDFSMLYISNEIGFTSLSHFNHVFKKIKGITPTEYRRRKGNIEI